MHLALALFRYFPFGGMQRDMLAIAQHAAERGHQVTIYCHTWQGARPDNIEVCVLNAAGRTNHSRARGFNRALQAQLASRQHEVVFGFDKMYGLDLYFAADPCFVTRTAHRAWPYRLTPRYRTFRDLEGGVFAEGGAKQILLLDGGAQHNYQATWGTEAARFSCLPPGVAEDRRKGPDAAALRAAGRAELGIDGDTTALLLLAANFELKGLDRAIEAVAALPAKQRARTRLLAFGQDAPKRLQQMVDGLGLADQVTMLPGRSDVPKLLQAADLLIHPARRDTTATVLLEAVAAGLPVVCTDVCGYAKHITKAGCGRVIPAPFSQDQLNEELRDLLSSDLTGLQDAASAYSQQQDLHGMHRYVCDLLESMGCDDAPAPSTSETLKS
jgi:UDP-glucose:(heptosyl)LPS alpha-1,3-glucosyltransferase